MLLHIIRNGHGPHTHCRRSMCESGVHEGRKKGGGGVGMKEWMKRTLSLSLRLESRSRKVLFSSTAPLKALNSLFYSRTKLKLKHI